MADVNSSLNEAMKLAGAIGVALVDWRSGMTLGTAGGGAGMDMEIAAAGNTEVIRAKHNNMEALGLTGDIEDMLITLDTQIHILRPLKKEPDLFIYIALEKSQANLAMARLKMRQIEGSLEV